MRKSKLELHYFVSIASKTNKLKFISALVQDRGVNIGTQATLNAGVLLGFRDVIAINPDDETGHEFKTFKFEP